MQKFKKDDISLSSFDDYYESDDYDWYQEAIADAINNDINDLPATVEVCNGHRVSYIEVSYDPTYNCIDAFCEGHSFEPEDIWRYCRDHANYLAGRKDYDEMKHHIEVLNKMAREDNWQ